MYSSRSAEMVVPRDPFKATPKSSTPDNSQLDAIIAAYIEATERAEKPDRQHLMAAHLEHAGELAWIIRTSPESSTAASPNTDAHIS